MRTSAIRCSPTSNRLASPLASSSRLHSTTRSPIDEVPRHRAVGQRLADERLVGERLPEAQRDLPSQASRGGRDRRTPDDVLEEAEDDEPLCPVRWHTPRLEVVELVLVHGTDGRRVAAPDVVLLDV